MMPTDMSGEYFLQPCVEVLLDKVEEISAHAGKGANNQFLHFPFALWLNSFRMSNTDDPSNKESSFDHHHSEA